MKRYLLSYLAAWAVSWVCLWVVVLAGFAAGFIIRSPILLNLAGCLLIALPFPLMGIRSGKKADAKQEKNGNGSENTETGSSGNIAADAEHTEKAEGVKNTDHTADMGPEKKALYILLAAMVPLSLLDASGVSPFLSTPGRLGLFFEDVLGLTYGGFSEALLILPANLLFPLLFHLGWKRGGKAGQT